MLGMPYSALQRFLAENKAGGFRVQSEYRLEAARCRRKVGGGHKDGGDYAYTLSKAKRPRREKWKGRYWVLVWEDGYMELEHRRIWIEHHGDIPYFWHVHHKNGDSLDNRLENLECLPGREHMELHSKAPNA